MSAEAINILSHTAIVFFFTFLLFKCNGKRQPISCLIIAAITSVVFEIFGWDGIFGMPFAFALLTTIGLKLKCKMQVGNMVINSRSN